jgi:hypothetical protein
MRYLLDAKVIIHCLDGLGEADELVGHLGENHLYARVATRIGSLRNRRLAAEHGQNVS